MFIAFLALTAAMAQVSPELPAVPSATPEKKICRSMVATGSVLPKHVCLTKTEWAKQAASSEAAWEAARGKRGFVTKDRSGRYD